MKTARITEYQSGTRTERIEGILIKKRDFGEGHSYFTIIDKNRGKTEFGAFGVRNLKSRRRNALMIGNFVSVVTYRKNDDSSPSAREAELIESYPDVRSNLHRMSYYYLIMEVLDILLEGEQHFPGYSLLLDTLDTMNGEERMEKYVLFFLFKTLRIEGIFPEYSSEILTELFHFTSPDFKLGNGSQRFLKDTEIAEDTAFWNSREVSVSVTTNLMELLSQTVKFHFNRPINSLSLINLHK